MKEREINRGEYSEIERHEYKGIYFFTAIYGTHIVLEPIHEELLAALSETDHDHERLWSDSAHSWARNMSLQEQRTRLIEEAHNDIDYFLSGQALKEQRKEYLSKRQRLREQLEFFKAQHRSRIR